MAGLFFKAACKMSTAFQKCLSFADDGDDDDDDVHICHSTCRARTT